MIFLRFCLFFSNILTFAPARGSAENNDPWNRQSSSSSAWNQCWLHWNRLWSESGKVFLRFLVVFSSILHFFRVRGGLGKTMYLGIDRARRVLLGISVGYIGIIFGANRERKNSNLLIGYPTSKFVKRKNVTFSSNTLFIL